MDDLGQCKMQDLRVNSILGSAIAAVLGVLGLNTLAESLVHPHYPKTAAYGVVLERETGGGESETAAVIDIGTLLASADIAAGAKVASKCKSCHVLAAGDSANVGPELMDVYGRTPAAVAGFGYSAAMKAVTAPWTAETLFGFLESPAKYVQGTAMNFVGIKKPEDRADLIAYLHSLKPGAPALPAPAPVPEAIPAEGGGTEALPADAAPAPEAAAGPASGASAAASPPSP